jgi:hypothetical protein
MEKHIVALGKTNPRKLFALARTYDELLELNVAFLQGRVSETPYHLGPIDTETVPLMKDLVDLHRQGRVFTTEGQPGLCEQGDWGFIEQRPYLCGFVEEETLTKILRHVRKTPKKFVYSFAHVSNGESICNFHNTFNLTRQKGKNDKEWELYTNLPYETGINLVKEAASESSLYAGNPMASTWHMKLAMNVPYCTGDLMVELREALGIHHHHNTTSQTSHTSQNKIPLQGKRCPNGYQRNSTNRNVCVKK